MANISKYIIPAFTLLIGFEVVKANTESSIDSIKNSYVSIDDTNNKLWHDGCEIMFETLAEIKNNNDVKHPGPFSSYLATLMGIYLSGDDSINFYYINCQYFLLINSSENTNNSGCLAVNIFLWSNLLKECQLASFSTKLPVQILSKLDTLQLIIGKELLVNSNNVDISTCQPQSYYQSTQSQAEWHIATSANKLLYATALINLSEIYEMAGMTERSSSCQSHAESICLDVYNNCYEPSKGMIAESPTKNFFSSLTNNLAIQTNTFSQAEGGSILQKCQTRIDNTGNTAIDNYINFLACIKYQSWQYADNIIQSLKYQITSPISGKEDSVTKAERKLLFNVLLLKRQLQIEKKSGQIHLELNPLNITKLVYKMSLGDVNCDIIFSNKKEPIAVIALPLNTSGTLNWHSNLYQLKNKWQQIKLK